MNFDEKDLMDVKEAYRKVYIKSKEFDLSSVQQNEILEKLITEIFMEKMNKLSDEGTMFTDSDKRDILTKIRVFINKWQTEFDEADSKHFFSNFFKK
ncbi:hypothetical protein [Ruminiclostridium cellobioparum]|uniref:Uncharacterized protein n=1 Tax=Ruminiclostridium cellobioparum subsp. termitidis CT1112 TaxID=1195236 RepID=S0FNF0_RUMCE|nr:hypothetical protein [Ruminiclostridium cellobioparum]EMS73765.1 hypothetical protein CTER_0299 [Ruminiclostridium cellobioparum subsp. termitidis CT1112]